VGDTVDWTYVVTNTGSAPLTDIIAVDYRAGGGVTTLDCEQDALDPGEDMECAIPPGVATPGQFVNYSGVVGTDPFGRRVADTDPSHHFGAEPGIHLKKYTNGLDADEPPGPYIAVDDPVEWTYVVTNTGNNTLQSIVVTDDPAQAITCPGDTLAPAGEMTCTATGVAARGQYENMATVVGEDSVGQTVTDTDPSHYFGFLAAIDIEKATNGEDADQPTGPLLPVGSEVTWTYVVTNPGDVPILNVDVTDDQGALPVFQGGDANGDDLLDPGETWTYEATGTVELGQYENLSTATGFAGFELGIPVSATDPSHYLGVEGAIRIEKTPDSAEVPRGNSHTFTIEVTNVGSVDLTDVVVTDLVVPACDRDIGDLGAGETVTYECAVDEVFETIENTAVVQGTVPDGSVVTDEDSATVTPVDTGGTAEIGDTVWSDLDSNGVQDAGEPGIAGARVRIVTVSETVDPQAAGDELQLQVDVTLVTDANGRYLQPALVAGTYEVTLDLASVDGNLTTAASFVIPLRAGESRLDADFGVVLSQISGEDSDDGTDAADPDDDRDLPLTGLEILRLVAVAMLLLALGSGTVLFTRLPPGAEPPSAEGP